MERRQETTIVKQALRRAGIPFRGVKHDTGTAWGWLKIKLAPGTPRAEQDRAIRIAQAVTGRRGDYDGRIIVV